MKTTSTLRASLLGWIALALVASGCDQTSPAPGAPQPRPVKSIVVAANDGLQVFTYSGTAKADIEADISFRIAGTVKSRPVQVGDQVKAGELLAALDTRDFTIQVKEAEAQLANTRSALRNAQANYDRVRDLYENDNVSRSELDSARAQSESTAAQLRITEQNLANSRLQLSYTRLNSPDHCAIAETFVKENENVSSGQTIVRLSCGDCAEVRVFVPETQIAQIALGGVASVSLAALSERKFSAVVSEVGVSMASKSSAFPVVVKLKEGCELVRPGMAADVEFRVATGAGKQILVPTVAVSEDRDGRFVYTLEQLSDNTWRASRQSVELGDPQSGGIVVASGLVAGQRVVTAGVRRISDGQVVRLYGGGS